MAAPYSIQSAEDIGNLSDQELAAVRDYVGNLYATGGEGISGSELAGLQARADELGVNRNLIDDLILASYQGHGGDKYNLGDVSDIIYGGQTLADVQPQIQARQFNPNTMRYSGDMSKGRAGTGVDISGSSGLREAYAPYVERMLERAAAEADVPFQKYTGTSPLLESAKAGIANLTTPAQFLQGSNLAQAAGIGALNYGQYKPTSFTTGTFANPNYTPQPAPADVKAYGGTVGYDAGGVVDTSSDLVNPSLQPVNYGGQNVTNVQASYMSPYMQGAIDPALKQAKRESDIMGQTAAAKAVGAGAFGGSRYGLVEAERQRNLANQLGSIQGRGLQEAYTQGLGQFNTEQQRALEAQKMAEQSRQFGAELGLKGLQTGIQAGSVLGNLGQQQGAFDLASLKQMADLGKDERTFDYNEFLRGEKYPYENLTFMRNMLTGLPISSADSYAAGGSGDAFQTFMQSLYGMNNIIPGSAEGGLISGIASLANDD